MATDRNTLKNWFRTGLKPTQSQFWAWLDSFWHKDEKIPISSIEGIDTALENKAETTALDSKANVDAAGLGDENIAKWKEVLGVGEVPDNMATIDKDGEQGNAYTKEQVDDLLENSGKNLGNSDLKVPDGAVRVLDVTGAKLQFKGLQNKKSDASFNLKPILNANGEFAISDEPDVTINLPENRNPPATQNITVNVNNVAPPTINVAYPPNFNEEIQELMANLTKIDWTDFTQDDYGLNPDGTSVFQLDINGYINSNVDVVTKSKLTFPFEKDWIVKSHHVSSSATLRIYREVFSGFEIGERNYYNEKQNILRFLIKKSNLLYIADYKANAGWSTKVFSLTENLGYIGFGIEQKTKISYKLLN